jgi:serine/threonine protein kinase
MGTGNSVRLGHTEPLKTPHLVKLIDFGLCTKAVTSDYDALRDFCGSPGFFAPEMLLADSYDGFKADVWSVGCILLEVRSATTSVYAKGLSMLTKIWCDGQLVLGNAAFSSEWMAIYDLSVLKDHERFADCIRAVRGA